jgi:thiamine-monophosphate kinase
VPWTTQSDVMVANSDSHQPSGTNRPPSAVSAHPPAAITHVGDVMERDLIARIQQRLPPAPGWVIVGIGDDAAVVEPERNRVEVLSVDALVEGVHFDRAFVPPDAVGHRALAVSLSDLAAMGAAPRLALVSLALPPALLLADFDGVLEGIASLAARARLPVVGGNLTRSPGPLMIDVTVMGTVKRRQALTRRGARPGDELYVSGTIGGASAALHLLRDRATLVDLDAKLAGAVRAEEARGLKQDVPLRQDVPAASSAPSVVERYLRPEPRLRLGTLLGRNRAASACMDLSDGLSDAVYQVADASGVGMVIDAGALPIDTVAGAVFESCRLDPVTEAITAGDDYELLIAVRPRARARLAAAMRHGDAPLTRIGVCTADRAVVLRRGGTDAALPRGGYAHFGA